MIQTSDFAPLDGITKIATDAADLIYEMSQPLIQSGMNLRFEYSPESFMGTEMDYAEEVCQAVLEPLPAAPEPGRCGGPHVLPPAALKYGAGPAAGGPRSFF